MSIFYDALHSAWFAVPGHVTPGALFEQLGSSAPLIINELVFGEKWSTVCLSYPRRLVRDLSNVLLMFSKEAILCSSCFLSRFKPQRSSWMYSALQLNVVRGISFF